MSIFPIMSETIPVKTEPNILVSNGNVCDRSVFFCFFLYISFVNLSALGDLL